jgi:hypothetical protein
VLEKKKLLGLLPYGKKCVHVPHADARERRRNAAGIWSAGGCGLRRLG